MCTRCSQWVHLRCSGLRNVVDYRRANDWICSTCSTLPQPCASSPLPSPAHTSTVSGGTMHIPGGAQRQSGGHSRVQAHGTIEKSQHPELHPSTTGQNLGTGGDLLVFIHNSVNFTRKSLSTPRRAEHQRVHPSASSCNGCY